MFSTDVMALQIFSTCGWLNLRMQHLQLQMAGSVFPYYHMENVIVYIQWNECILWKILDLDWGAYFKGNHMKNHKYLIWKILLCPA